MHQRKVSLKVISYDFDYEKICGLDQNILIKASRSLSRPSVEGQDIDHLTVTSWLISVALTKTFWLKPADQVLKAKILTIITKLHSQEKTVCQPFVSG